MECGFCGKDVKTLVKGQPLCKEHVIAAREARDQHNAKVREEKAGEDYFTTVQLNKYNKALEHMEAICRTTAGYQLNKLYVKSQEQE